MAYIINAKFSYRNILYSVTKDTAISLLRRVLGNSTADVGSKKLLCSRVIEECQSSPAAVEEISVSFFNLLETIMKTENLSSTALVGHWTRHPDMHL